MSNIHLSGYDDSPYHIRVKSIADAAVDGMRNLANAQMGGTLMLPSNARGLAVTELGAHAFQDNFAGRNIQTVIIPDSVVKIGAGAFENCTELEQVVLSSQSQLQEIGDGAFAGCTSLVSFGFVDSIEIIGAGAFCNTGLVNVTLPAGLEELGRAAFAECQELQTISIHGNNACFATVDGVLYSKNKANLLLYPAAKVGSTFSVPSTVNLIDAFAIYGNSNLQQIDLANAENIYQSGLANCTNLSQITGNQIRFVDVDSLWGTAWWEDNSDTYVTLGRALLKYQGNESTVTVSAEQYECVQSFAFADNQQLEAVNIEVGVVNIRTGAFAGCSNLQTVTVFGETYCGPMVFEGCGDDLVINVPYYLLFDFYFVEDCWQSYKANMDSPLRTITLDSDGGSVCELQYFGFGEVLTLPIPTKEGGCCFKGWFDANGKQYVTGEVFFGQSDITLKARWVFNVVFQLFEPHIVTFDLMGQPGNVPQPQKIDALNSTGLVCPSVAPVDGYAFAGWYKDLGDANAYDFSQPVVESVRLFAKWIKLKDSWTDKTIKVGGNSGNIEFADDKYFGFVSLLNQNVTIYTARTSGTPRLYLYDALGNLVLEGVSRNTYDSQISINVQAGRLYYIKINSYSCYTNGNAVIYLVGQELPQAGGKYDMPLIVNLEFEKNFAIEPAEKAGYDFVGWFAQPDCQGRKYTDNLGNGLFAWDSTGDTVLYAGFSPKSYTVSFDARGGTRGTLTKSSFLFGDPVGTLPNATKQNFVFDGWYTVFQGQETRVTTQSTFVFGYDGTSIVFYAKWACVLTFVTGNGTVCQSISKPVGTQVTLPASVLGGHTGRWQMKKVNGSSVTASYYDFFASFAMTANVEFSAAWTEKTLANCFRGGIGEVYTLNHLHQMKAIQDTTIVNPYNFVLMQDLVYTGTSWTPVPIFNSILDCNNKTISGLKIQITSAGTGDYGLVAINMGAIKNLKISGTIVENINTGERINVGMIAGRNSGEISNCTVLSGSTITTQRPKAATGGVTGQNSFSVFSVKNYATIKASGNSGGIAGASSDRIRDCENRGAITYDFKTALNASVGGVVGYNYGLPHLGFVKDNRNYGAIKIAGAGTTNCQPYVALVIGYTKPGSISGNSPAGSLDSGGLSSAFKYSCDKTWFPWECCYNNKKGHSFNQLLYVGAREIGRTSSGELAAFALVETPTEEFWDPYGYDSENEFVSTHFEYCSCSDGHLIELD